MLLASNSRLITGGSNRRPKQKLGTPSRTCGVPPLKSHFRITRPQPKPLIACALARVKNRYSVCADARFPEGNWRSNQRIDRTPVNTRRRFAVAYWAGAGHARR